MSAHYLNLRYGEHATVLPVCAGCGHAFHERPRVKKGEELKDGLICRYCHDEGITSVADIARRDEALRIEAANQKYTEV